jgi:hypothetical protein
LESVTAPKRGRQSQQTGKLPEPVKLMMPTLERPSVVSISTVRNALYTPLLGAA